MVSKDSEYENLVGERVEVGSVNLEDITGEKLVDTTNQIWEDHWQGMPEYVSEDTRYKHVRVQFRTKEDYEEFQALIGQKLTLKTQGIWFPALEREENFLMRWIEDDA